MASFVEMGVGSERGDLADEVVRESVPRVHTFIAQHYQRTREQGTCCANHRSLSC